MYDISYTKTRFCTCPKAKPLVIDGTAERVGEARAGIVSLSLWTLDFLALKGFNIPLLLKAF